MIEYICLQKIFYKLGSFLMKESIKIRVVCPKHKTLDYPAEHQLQPFVPKGAIQLNYGQGEGQIRIGESIWGIYWSAPDVYSIQFEEGDLTLSEFVVSLEKIKGALQSYFSFSVELRLSGALHGREPHERYL